MGVGRDLLSPASAGPGRPCSLAMAAACYLACLLALSATCGVKAFNLEPRIPVIKNGEHGSFFGFSVALHQSTETRFDGSEEQRNW